MELEANLANISRQQLGLAAISYDSSAVLKGFAERKNIAFPLLSDPDSKTIRAWGILNETVAKDSPFYGIPHPGTFILDVNGVVVSKFFEEDYRERYTASVILARQFGVAADTQPAAIETRHLRLAMGASVAAASSGQRVVLTLDVALKPGMHVYAPGVEGYIPINWSLAESPAIKIHPASYPPSKKLHLPAIGETVPVYERDFRLMRDINIGPDAKVKPALTPKGDLVISGTFRYQACDDRICYVPESVPLTWTVHYVELDRQRAPVELQRKEPAW